MSQTDSAGEETSRQSRWHDKDDQILVAAEKIFFTVGFSDGSMQAIAHTAGVSKQTLYHHYVGKSELFSAVVHKRIRELLSQLAEEVVTEGAPGDNRSPRDVLTHLGEEFLQMVMAAECVELHRAIVTEVPRQPGLGETVYVNGPQQAVKLLADYLRRQTGAGVLDVRDPELAAEQFFGMTMGHCQLRALFGVEEGVSGKDITERTAAAVDVFLAAYETRKS